MAKIKFVTDANGVKFYPITIANAIAYIKTNGDQVKLNEFLDNIDYSTKADKVENATANNFAGLDANGNLIDSGKKATDFQPAGDYKTTQTAKESPNADGEAVAFIDTVSQNANGEITATKKTIPNVVASTDGVGGSAGLMTAAQAETLAAIELGAEVNVLEGVQVNGTDLTIDANKKVNVTITEGDGNGQIKVNGTNVDVHGLGTAAYEASTAFDTAGAAATVKSEVIGTASDASTDNTIYGAKKKAEEEAAAVLGSATDAASANTVYGAKAYADSLVVGGVIYKGAVNADADLPTTNYKAGWEYMVATTGTYAGKSVQAGDFLIANKDYEAGDVASNVWAVKQGTVAVTDSNASLVIGTATKVAEVEGVEIHVTQVEDLTKIEAIDVADTTEYADVSSLFTA